jgi:hypothetical protein
MTDNQNDYGMYSHDLHAVCENVNQSRRSMTAYFETKRASNSILDRAVSGKQTVEKAVKGITRAGKTLSANEQRELTDLFGDVSIYRPRGLNYQSIGPKVFAGTILASAALAGTFGDSWNFMNPVMSFTTNAILGSLLGTFSSMFTYACGQEVVEYLNTIPLVNPEVLKAAKTIDETIRALGGGNVLF